MDIQMIANIEEEQPAPVQTLQEPAENAEVTQHTPDTSSIAQSVFIAIAAGLIVSYLLK